VAITWLVALLPAGGLVWDAYRTLVASRFYTVRIDCLGSGFHAASRGGVDKLGLVATGVPSSASLAEKSKATYAFNRQPHYS
jgi:hypothetical protein